MDYVIESFYPDIWLAFSKDKQAMHLDFFKEVVTRTAKLVAEWQCVGFCHGVLNTDNMSILGLTIDYGPFGFMDAFDEEFICNGSDEEGRYSYKNQPEMCKWNCHKLGEALAPVVPRDRTKAIVDSAFDAKFQTFYLDKMRKKLGLLRAEAGDAELVAAFLAALQATGADFTNSWRALHHLSSDAASGDQAALVDALVRQSCSLETLRSRFASKVDGRQLAMLRQLAAAQPGVLEMLGGAGVWRRELANEERRAALSSLDEASKKAADRLRWADWVALYAARVARERPEDEHERRRVMLDNNPRIVLRNYLAQQAIDAAEKGDYSEVRRLLTRLELPYREPVDGEANDAAAASDCATDACDDALPPAWARTLRVT